MTREVEMNKAFKLYEKERARFDSLPYYDLWEGFKAGFKYADQHPQYFRGQSDEMMERESLFVDDWYKEHKGEMPTYADAIAWAEKTMIDKAIEWLKANISNRAINVSTEDEFKIIIGTKTWNDFRKAMEE